MNDRLKPSGGDDGGGPARTCGRAEDMVAYLYGESTRAEALSFNEHLDACATCRGELSAFGVVREGIGAWREEVLSGAPRIEFTPAFTSSADISANTPANTSARSVERRERKRSALAALREFFALAPPWLRAGSVAAALAVCAFMGLAVARTEVRWDDEGFALRTGVPVRTIERRVEVPAPGMFTEQQVDEIAERRARQAIEKYQAQSETAREKQVVNVASDGVTEDVPDRPVAVRVKGERQSRRNQSVVQPKSKRNPRQAIESEPNDEELPRLYDLLREAN